MSRGARLRAAIAAAILAAIALTACSNPFDFAEAVKTEVMIARNMFLKVTASLPGKDATGVNPVTAVTIQFDRAIDEGTITAETIQIQPPVECFFSYNPAARTLVITPAALEGQTVYTVVVTKGVKGVDGSELQAEYAWMFTTRKAPSGSVRIAGGGAYTRTRTVTLSLSYNTLVTDMRFAESPTSFDPGDSDWVGDKRPTYEFVLASGDGPKTVYVQFRDADDARTDPAAISDEITLDETPPAVTSLAVADGAAYVNSSTVAIAIGASDATSGVAQMEFTNDGVTWSGWEPWNPTRAAWELASGDGLKTVQARVMDTAGNVSAGAADTVTLDQTAPTVSVFTIGSGQSLHRPRDNYVSVNAGEYVTAGMPVSFMIHKDPTSGSFMLAGRLMDVDIVDPPVDQYSNPWSHGYSAPFSDVPEAGHTVSGSPGGAICYRIDVQN